MKITFQTTHNDFKIYWNVYNLEIDLTDVMSFKVHAIGQVTYGGFVRHCDTVPLPSATGTASTLEKAIKRCVEDASSKQHEIENYTRL